LSRTYPATQFSQPRKKNLRPACDRATREPLHRTTGTPSVLDSRNTPADRSHDVVPDCTGTRSQGFAAYQARAVRNRLALNHPRNWDADNVLSIHRRARRTVDIDARQRQGPRRGKPAIVDPSGIPRPPRSRHEEIAHPSRRHHVLSSKLAPPPLHPDQRLARLHLPLLHLHILPQPALRLLQLPPAYPLPDLLQLVRPLLLRLQQQLVPTPPSHLLAAARPQHQL
ncbi:hypothetical protein CI238_04503, partial [Colletotrichum incanum]